MREYCQPTFIHEQNLFFKLRNIWFKGWTVIHHLYFLKYYTDLQRTLAKQWHFQGMWKLFEKVLMSPSLIPKCGHGKQLPGELVLFKFWMFIAEKTWLTFSTENSAYDNSRGVNPSEQKMNFFTITKSYAIKPITSLHETLVEVKVTMNPVMWKSNLSTWMCLQWP